MALWCARTAVIAAAAFVAAAPASAATINAQVKAKVVKPLVLRSIQNLDLGRIVLGPGTWSGATVSLSRGGILTCSANVTCSGATQVAQYNVAGTNNQTVIINAPNVTMVNQSDTSKTIVLVPDRPATVSLGNSSPRGTNFPIGGRITVDSSTAGGTYVGTFQVTAEYQ